MLLGCIFLLSFNSFKNTDSFSNVMCCLEERNVRWLPPELFALLEEKNTWGKALFQPSTIYCKNVLLTFSLVYETVISGYSYFCAWPYWICICRSFAFRRKIYGRRVIKWITQHDLLRFSLIKLVFAPLFNAQKKHVLNYFAPVS